MRHHEVLDIFCTVSDGDTNKDDWYEYVTYTHEYCKYNLFAYDNQNLYFLVQLIDLGIDYQ